MGVFSDGGPGLFCPAPSEKINYRSVGRGDGGVETSAKKNSFFRRDFDFDWPSVPSIPGKFETVLYRGNNEDKGFGCRMPRFGQESRHGELPGPGAHSVPPGSGRSAASVSVGKRGHGSFASRSQRNRTRAAEAPGPGAYVTTSSGSAPPSSPKGSSAFVPPSSVNPAKFHARPSPGPCDYVGATGTKAVPPNADGGGAAMTRAPKHYVETEKAPGPGAYTDSGPTRRGHSFSARRPPGTPRRRLISAPDTSATAGVSESALRHLATEALAESSAKPVASGPGPGAYDPELSATTGGGQTSFSTTESHAFIVGMSHCPRGWREASPGPGYYESSVAAEATQRQPVRYDFGTSQAERFRDKQSVAPGPAYYSPPRKSIQNDFHLNPQQNWV